MKVRCVYDKLVPLTELVPSPKNRNKHSPEQIKRLSDIFEYQGIRHPIIVSNLSGFIVAGHGRLEAARKNGYKEFPVNYQDFPNEEAEYAFLVSDNSIALWAELDLAGINADIGDLGPEFDIDMLGIEGFEIEPMDKFDPLTDEDSVPEEPVEPKTKLGDLYKLGEHRLLCGDCTDKQSFDYLMDGAKADMVFTDPPYGVSYTKKNECLNSIVGGHRLTNAIENDELCLSDMRKLWASVFRNAAESCSDRASYYICSPQGGGLMTMMQTVDQSPWCLKHSLIWAKNNHVLGRCDYHYKHEPILYGWKKKGVHDFFGKGEHTKSTWEIPKPHYSYLHPTMKPIALMENALLNSTKVGQICLDPFGGSGSTLIACEKTKRKCCMMELEPKYCDVIVKRWEDYTGKKAELLNEPSPFVYPNGEIENNNATAE